MAYQSSPPNWLQYGRFGELVGRGVELANMTDGSNFNSSPESNAYYAMQQGNALRGISAQYAPQRSYALQALESRGLGRSSEVGRTLGSLAASQGMAGQQAISDIQGQQYAERQARINAYMNYLYQKKLQKSGSGGVLGALGSIGQSVGSLIGGDGGGDDPYAVTGSTPYYPGGGGYG